MRRSQPVFCLLALLYTGCQAHAGKWAIQPNGNDDGCNGVPHGISCCEDDFIVGDNIGKKEQFIQADEYIRSCFHTCKRRYPKSVGITESLNETYDSGLGKNESKCWCEFGKPKLNTENRRYKTCIFREVGCHLISENILKIRNGKLREETLKILRGRRPDCIFTRETSPSNVTVADFPPKYLMVVSTGDAAVVQNYKIGRYTLQTWRYNHFPYWKKQHILPEQYLFMSDQHHWGIGPDIDTNMFGILSEDRPTPILPHLTERWMFWDGQYWTEDNSLQVLAGERKDVGVNREIIMLDFKTAEIDNVNDTSQCCEVCLDVMFNYDKKKNECGCFKTPTYMNYGLYHSDAELIVLTRYNPNITSGLCDTNDFTELARRSGEWEIPRPNYNYSDVQGPLGMNRTFHRGNLKTVDFILLDKTKTKLPVDHTSCCRECLKENPWTQIYTYEFHEKGNFAECACDEVLPGTRPVTQFFWKRYAGICDSRQSSDLIAGLTRTEEIGESVIRIERIW